MTMQVALAVSLTPCMNEIVNQVYLGYGRGISLMPTYLQKIMHLCALSIFDVV